MFQVIIPVSLLRSPQRCHRRVALRSLHCSNFGFPQVAKRTSGRHTQLGPVAPDGMPELSGCTGRSPPGSTTRCQAVDQGGTPARKRRRGGNGGSAMRLSRASIRRAGRRRRRGKRKRRRHTDQLRGPLPAEEPGAGRVLQLAARLRAHSDSHPTQESLLSLCPCDDPAMGVVALIDVCVLFIGL